MDALDFGSLYERYSGDVFRFALYLTGNRADAEDIAAETFARAWSAPGGIRLPTVKAYLLMIARNLNLERYRRAGRTAALETAVADRGKGPEASAIDRDEVRAVLSALARLPEADRSALLMRAVGGLSYQAIGAALGLSDVAVRVKVHRVRLRLGESRVLSGRGGNADHP
jgi:RNA polymerase sigma-70 factor (ECF subfamily)